VAAITIRFDLPAHFLDVRDQRAGFVLLAAFLISFLFIRTSARLMRSPKVPWWPGSVTTSGGLHLHHLVWGIVLLLIGGFLGFATHDSSPGSEIEAAVFGVGAGLTLDEFALLIYLRDVYWAKEGRTSFDAVVVALVLGGLIILGFAPFDLRNNGSSVRTLVTLTGLNVLFAALAIVKGKRLLGMVGLFFLPASVCGVMRLASPTSPWARRLYDPDGHRMARSRARWTRITARRRRIADAIAGAPGAPVPAIGQPNLGPVDQPVESEPAPTGSRSRSRRLE
jgi:hypothetical protein